MKRYGINARIWVAARSRNAALTHVSSLLEDLQESDQDVTEVTIDRTNVQEAGA